MTSNRTIQAADVLRQAPGVTGRVVDGEAVLVHAGQRKVRVLNEVGARIWELADGHRTVSVIAGVIASEYAVDPDRAEQDVKAFCTGLVDRGLLALD